MNTVRNKLADHAQFDENFESYPAFEVTVDLEALYEDARSTAFDRLLTVDMDEACAAILRGDSDSKDLDEAEENIFVRAAHTEGAEQPHLVLIVGRGYTDVQVNIDPAKFDRTNPNHENLLQRCARLVQAINQCPTEDDSENPIYDGFECLRGSDGVDPDEMTARWARLAEIWSEASKPV